MDKGLQQNLMSMYGGEPRMSTMDKAFVDAIDGDTATIITQDGRTQQVPVSALPQGIREGQYLGDEGGDFDPAAESARIEGRRKKLVSDDPGGDITL